MERIARSNARGWAMQSAWEEPVGDAACESGAPSRPWAVPVRCAVVVLLWLALVQLVGAQAPPSPVYRFFNQATGTHFYTIVAAERDHVLGSYPQFLYEGP